MLVVNANNDLNWNGPLVETIMVDRGCFHFHWNNQIVETIDIIYLTLCVIPLLSIIFVVWSIVGRGQDLVLTIFPHARKKPGFWNQCHKRSLTVKYNDFSFLRLKKVL